MAVLTIPSESRRIEDADEIREFLKPFGIWYENWPVEDRVDPDASNEEILEAYSEEINRLKEQGGYVTADVINVTPDIPGLDEMLAKFSKEHTHSEDEIRFIVKGSGVFHINLPDTPVFAIQTDGGDMINVPANTRHWFDLCDDKLIRAIRLFLDKSGWTPHYVDDPVNENYTPVCWGPNYISPGDKIDPIVKP